MARIRYFVWTDERVEALRRLYATEPARTIAQLLGTTDRSVYSKATALGLKKPGEWIAERTRRLMADPNHPGRRSWFKPGQIPPNKGKPMPSKGRSIETQFKKGLVPHNWNPIGHTRVTKDGYLERKVADTGCTRRDYVGLHHLVWRWHGNSIPKGHALVFRDGNPRNFDINNLELISRADLLRRNSVHRHGPEIAQAYQLIGAIRRQINRKTKAQQVTA